MNKHQQRKATPVYSGVLNYFPDAINAIAQCSKAGNDQHNPNTPLHWDRAKSGDELDACLRHLMEAGTIDDDGILHSTKAAWRALGNLQKELEKAGEAPLSEYNEPTPPTEYSGFLTHQKEVALLLEQSDYGEGIIENGIYHGTPIKDLIVSKESSSPKGDN